MTPEEYEARKNRLEANAEDARKALARAQKYYDNRCDELRELRIGWQEQQRKAKDGLVIKVGHWPDRVKTRRSAGVHAADMKSGKIVKTACKKSYSESGVDLLDENAPITCEKCQKAIEGGW